LVCDEEQEINREIWAQVIQLRRRVEEIGSDCKRKLSGPEYDEQLITT
jgi:hypothetical protein